jgi:dTDP-4-dehydrorhamnose reductase
MSIESENIIQLFSDGSDIEQGKSQQKKTIMIIGISSFVGSNLAQYLKKHYRIIGTYNENPVRFHGILSFRLDILNKDAVDKVIFIFKPDIVIYAVGMSSLVECEFEPKIADALNTAGVFNVTSSTERFGTKIILLSSCYVFAGEETDDYEEQDSPMPSSIYGATIGASEFYIQKSCLNYLIFRCPPLFGRSFRYFQMTFLEFLEQKFFKGMNFYADDKIVTGFFDVFLLGKVIHKVLNDGYSNRLFQVSSSDSMTRMKFAQTLAEVLGMDPGLASRKNSKFPFNEEKIFTSDFRGIGHFSMSVENLEATTQIKLPTVKEMLIEYYAQMGQKSDSKDKKKAGAGINYI